MTLCTLCGERKPRVAFHVMRSMYDGRYPAARSAGGMNGCPS
jgi:hypothetical protein